ncbi:MAG: N-acetylglucosamine-6-phosphate deacetylase [Tannerella sp.]|nr:N-acetylglucosamine-6-phosphate deacetylase [Tannerella sp.]
MIRIEHIDIYAENEIIRDGSLLIDGERIAAVLPSADGGSCDEVIDGSGLTAVPGYIDAHCHGGGGSDCNDGTVEAIVCMRDFYSQHGVTTLFPTIAADRIDATIAAMDAVREVMKANDAGKTHIAGCHLEGPFLNKAFKGSQAESSLIPMTDSHLQLFRDYADVIKRITISPEVERNADYFPFLRDMGIQISVGHSNAEYSDIVRAVELGATSVTHLYNAMSQTKKVGPFRVGGVVEAGLTLDALYAEIIADGYHLPDELIRIAYRCKGADKLSVCSDANRAAGGVEGEVFHSCGETYIIDKGVVMNYARTSLASSLSPLDVMVRHLIFKVGLPVADVVKMTSLSTAKMMGIAERKGSIAVGKDADINLVDKNFNVVQTYFRGEIEN